MLESANVPNWRVLLWVKFIEAACQLRPKSLFRVLAHPDSLLRAGMRWYSNIGRRVWIYEIWQWLFHDRRTNCGPRLAEFLKRPWRAEWVGLTQDKLPQPWHPAPDPIFLTRVETGKLASLKADAFTQP